MKLTTISQIHFELGRIEGLVAASESAVVEAVNDSVDAILEMLDREIDPPEEILK